MTEKKAPPEDADQAEQPFQFIHRRTLELQKAGMTKGRARGIAMLEDRIARWPPEWGNELQILIYGDFEPPSVDWDFPDLGIVVKAGPVKNTIITTALCVVKACVTVPEKNIAGLVDASSRINKLLGAWAAVDWGNAGNGWWSSVTHASLVGVHGFVTHDVLLRANKTIEQLRPDVRHEISSALYSIREPRQMMMEGYRSDILRVYSGYWNAFENLIEAVSLLQPPQKSSKQEKQEQINQFLAKSGGKLNSGSVTELYRIVDPGFIAKASHALKQCFHDHADGYIHECFFKKPERDRLYKIRNEINHGVIDAGNLEELIRVEDKHHRLWFIVFGMLGRLIDVPCPVNSRLDTGT